MAFANLGRLRTSMFSPRDEIMVATNLHCTKCANQEYETSEFRATGGFLSKIFDIQSRKSTTVTCIRCKYTEIYKLLAAISGLNHIAS